MLDTWQAGLPASSSGLPQIEQYEAGVHKPLSRGPLWFGRVPWHPSHCRLIEQLSAVESFPSNLALLLHGQRSQHLTDEGPRQLLMEPYIPAFRIFLEAFWQRSNNSFLIRLIPGRETTKITPTPFHHLHKVARINFMIKPEVDRSRKLTTFTVSGTVTARDFATAIRSFYAGEITLHALWDFRDGDVQLTDAEIWNRARSVSTLNLSTRRGGKTAFVARKGTSLGLAKMYQLITDTMSLPFEIKVFTDLMEAKHWLGIEGGPDS
jgi:hypothetical protein